MSATNFNLNIIGGLKMNVKDIKKIDIHAHATPFREYFPPHWKNKPEGVMVSAETLIEMHDSLGIEKGIILPISSPEGQPSVMSSEACKYLVDKNPSRFDWFCNVDPRANMDKANCDLTFLLRHYKSLGAKGVGEITAHIDADDPKMLNLFAACEECDMPVLIHIAYHREWGYGIYDDLGLPRIEAVLKKFPGLKLIGHSQAFWSELSGDVTLETRGKYGESTVVPGGRVVELMQKYPNIYCDLSAGSGHHAMMRDEAFFAWFVEKFSDRIMYGCDICHPDNTHPFIFRDFLYRMIEEGKLREETYVKIVRENAIRILKLEV